MNEKNKRAYVYRYRPYNYRENAIREASRTRKIRKQLLFTKKDYKAIENKILEVGAESFSEYIRNCIYNKEVTREDLEKYATTDDFKEKRKQICFNNEEIELIEKKMKQLDCSNFTLFITTIASI